MIAVEQPGGEAHIGSEDGRTSPEAEADFATAVAGIGKLVPQAPEGLLAPRLRMPLFVIFLLLAIGTHAGGIASYLLLKSHDGDGGQIVGALGSIVIEAEIIDGQDVPGNGGHTDAAVPGSLEPLAPVAVEQEASQPQTMLVEPPAAAEEAIPEILMTPSPSEAQIAAAMPPPPFRVDTSVPPLQAAPPDAQAAPAPDTEPEKSVTQSQPAPAHEASRASTGGDGGMAKAVKQTDERGGRAGANRGEIRSYHARLGARIRSNKPSGRGSRGFVEIAFALEIDGRLAFAAVKRSSGNAMLEARALDAVRKSAPFPKPPAVMTGRQLQFSVPFTFE